MLTLPLKQWTFQTIVNTIKSQKFVPFIRVCVVWALYLLDASLGIKISVYEPMSDDTVDTSICLKSMIDSRVTNPTGNIDRHWERVNNSAFSNDGSE